MKNFIYTAFLFLFVAGCKPGIPSDIIQPDKMALVLHDIHIVDAYITTIPNIDTSRTMAAAYYSGIYKRYEIDSALYGKSMAYYSQHPKVLDGIYDKVTKGLTKQKNVLVKADSLVNAKAAKVLKAKFKADSVKRADSLKKVTAPQRAKFKADSLKKVIAVKKADSIKKVDSTKKAKAVLRKAIRKKRADSIKARELLKKTINKK
ncbi:DUF4296 domain-containing protein [Pedobacter sp. V48]|uniref:DUF4296 domain-containing protein n=1 Tax=Pedobacter sp. V48 TaxID=509635 RepID=UPI0003E59A67|nr:DUF4296 domain-containing protein [Pedobacter sp. V48]ETZ21035.1 hypothetical protein N824_02670 [Pedobacter sp. V48]